jgi:hypothetical protein
MTKHNIGSALLLLALSAVIVSGCVGIGPKTVTKDRFDYSGAIADSWKTQMLLNIVKVRYGDAPVFLDVTSSPVPPARGHPGPSTLRISPDQALAQPGFLPIAPRLLTLP